MIKPIAYLINDREHCTGIHSVQSMKDVGLTEKTMQDRWGDALVPLYAIPEGYALVPIEPTSRMLYASEETQLREFCTSSRQSRQHDIAGQIYAEMIKAGGLK